MTRKILLSALLMFPLTVVAGPWCLWMVEEEVSCAFESAEICMQKAGRDGGYCRPNRAEFGSKGLAPLCLVTSTMRNCKYYTRNSCLRAARDVDGGCVENTELALRKGTSSNEGFRGFELGD